MAMTALLLIPLMIFAAFSVDIGAWYAHAARAQRASDAAALAAVVYMPDYGSAQSAALDQAARNGFVDGVDGVVVTVTAIGSYSVHVDIEAESPAYFGRVVMDGITLTRGATAEYVTPVPMGNPTSSIGTGDLDLQGTNAPANYHLNTHAHSTPVEYGDLLNSGPITTNPYYLDVGYIFEVEKPAGVEVQVQVLHSGECKRPNWPDSRGEYHAGTVPHIEFDLYQADNTPITHIDNIVPANQFGAQYLTDHTGNVKGDSVGASCPDFLADGSWDDPKWLTMWTIPAGAQAGKWYLTSGSPSGSTSHKNMYGLRTLSSNLPGGQEYCSTLQPATVTFGNCATINALGRMSVYIGENRNDPSVSTTAASFYFAEIDAIHAGKTMQIELWDPGEGSNYLQFLDPNGQIMPFRYRTQDRWGTPVAAWVDTAAVCPWDGSTSHCMPAAHHDRIVIIEILLEDPAGGVYTCNGSDCWWQVNYVSTANVNDTTTWSVKIIGNPIHLTE